MAKAPTPTRYQAWYKKNRKRIAAERRERYRDDPVYRARKLQACKDWRQRNRPWLKREKTERDYLLISEFAEQVGCSPETLRNMERDKLLPRTTNGVARRRYHPSNVRLVLSLVGYRRDHHYSEPKYYDRLKVLVAKVKTNWKKV